MSAENGKTMFEEAAAERELEELRREIEESRARRRRANDAFDEFLKGFATGRAAPAPAEARPLARAGVRTGQELPRVPPPPAPPPQAELPAPPPAPTPQAALQAPPAPKADVPAPSERETSGLERLDDFATETPAITGSAPLVVPVTQVPAWRSPAARIGTVAAVGVAALAAIVFVSRGRTPAEPAAPAAEVRTPAREVPAPPPVQAAVPTSGNEAPPSAELTTIRRVWLRVIADGARVVEREVPADTKIPLRASSQIVIRAGDAGAVRVSVGGKDQGLLGPTGQAVTRTLTMPGQPKNR
jgi:hypothetical protein